VDYQNKHVFALFKLHSSMANPTTNKFRSQAVSSSWTRRCANYQRTIDPEGCVSLSQGVFGYG
jgi:hypothetical protein